MSKDIRIKGRQLFEEGKVVKELETDKRVHFKVVGETDTHSIIFDKERGKFSCDCKFSTLHNKICSHIIASQLYYNCIKQTRQQAKTK